MEARPAVGPIPVGIRQAVVPLGRTIMIPLTIIQSMGPLVDGKARLEKEVETDMHEVLVHQVQKRTSGHDGYMIENLVLVAIA